MSVALCKCYSNITVSYQSYKYILNFDTCHNLEEKENSHYFSNLQKHVTMRVDPSIPTVAWCYYTGSAISLPWNLKKCYLFTILFELLKIQQAKPVLQTTWVRQLLLEQSLVFRALMSQN